jgi:uncharacterized protein (TIGR02453 family)
MAAPDRFTGFSDQALQFMLDLQTEQSRTWFKAHQDDFNRLWKRPLELFMSELTSRLVDAYPGFADAEPRYFRIQRDTRFARDKSPYKTQAGIYFRHERSKEAYSPGLYLHLEPRNVFAGGGMWHTDTKTAHAVRTAIAKDPDGWAEAKAGIELADGESLKRVPSAFDKDHVHADDLRRKDFAAIQRFTQKEATTEGFLDRYEDACRSFTPLMNFLCGAVGVPY